MWVGSGYRSRTTPVEHSWPGSRSDGTSKFRQFPSGHAGQGHVHEPPTGHAGQVRSRALLVLAIALALALAGGLVLRAQASRDRRADETVCRALQQLDGQSYDERVVDRIHAAGKSAGTRLGHIADDADGQSWPGHLVLASEDYDHVASRCFELHLRAPNVE